MIKLEATFKNNDEEITGRFVTEQLECFDVTHRHQATRWRQFKHQSKTIKLIKLLLRNKRFQGLHCTVFYSE